MKVFLLSVKSISRYALDLKLSFGTDFADDAVLGFVVVFPIPEWN